MSNILSGGERWLRVKRIRGDLWGCRERAVVASVQSRVHEMGSSSELGFICLSNDFSLPTFHPEPPLFVLLDSRSLYFSSPVKAAQANPFPRRLVTVWQQHSLHQPLRSDGIRPIINSPLKMHPPSTYT
ncbi:hypothetical protein DPEC_G00285030 [Dallia pectoralis]|uniref:Uncharacterized protein n=1 Tax=Dallia pectoralis TaxID=75939 RepID=A0ACC2FJL7_DALPE|nr:hypothetical protein DPEC_G00285030 [Dallia pectoralis]